MRNLQPALGLLCASAVSYLAAPLALARPLEIFFVDVEGGQATLIVSPSGQSLLIDTGWRGFEGRDADRIVQAAKAAKVKQIDYLLITHYHRDHVGGVPQLADQMKILNFVDHGPNTEDSKVTKEDYSDYVKVIQRGEHMVVKPGDTVPIKGLSVKVLTANGEHIQTPLAGRGTAEFFLRDDTQTRYRPDRERAIAGRAGHVREVSVPRPGRSDVEQRAGADVPQQSDRNGGRAAGVASRAESVEFAGAGGCGPSARGDHEQRRAQGRQPGRVADREGFAGPGRPVATALRR